MKKLLTGGVGFGGSCRVSEDNILKYLPRRSCALFKFYQQKSRWFNETEKKK